MENQNIPDNTSTANNQLEEQKVVWEGKLKKERKHYQLLLGAVGVLFTISLVAQGSMFKSKIEQQQEIISHKNAVIINNAQKSSFIRENAKKSYYAILNLVMAATVQNQLLVKSANDSAVEQKTMLYEIDKISKSDNPELKQYIERKISEIDEKNKIQNEITTKRQIELMQNISNIGKNGPPTSNSNVDPKPQ